MGSMTLSAASIAQVPAASNRKMVLWVTGSAMPIAWARATQGWFRPVPGTRNAAMALQMGAKEEARGPRQNRRALHRGERRKRPKSVALCHDPI
jgi:hypothetical protein